MMENLAFGMRDDKEDKGEKEISTSKRSAKEVFFDLSNLFWELIKINFLFLVFCIPVVTIPAAITGMTKVSMNLVRTKSCSVWRDFWGEFKASFLKSLGAGIIFGIISSAVYLLGSVLSTTYNGFLGILGVAIIVVFGILLYIVLCYVFSLIAIVNISLRDCIKNAFILFLIEPKHNFILLVPLALLLLGIVLYPINLLIMGFLGFSTCQYLVCSIVNKVIQNHIITPHEQRNIS